MSAEDRAVSSSWEAGNTLEAIAASQGKTPTSIAHKLVRLGFFECRAAVNEANIERGGGAAARIETDEHYTIYLVRSPITQAPIYVGQTQSFDARMRMHIKRFEPMFGMPPIIEALTTMRTYRQARAEERRQIAAFEAKGHILFNVQDREECAPAVKPVIPRRGHP